MSAPGGDNTRVVIAALTGNLLIALSKFVAAFFSGSAATLAEAVHSVADTLNQVLLMVGMRRAARPPTPLHPFGHAVESYFWPFLVSIMLFLLGGAFALYEGTHQLLALHRGEPEAHHGSSLWSYVVLGTSFAFESYSFWVASGEFRKMRAGRSIGETLMHAKDPTIPVVLMEDTAALVGLGVALLAVALSDVTGWSGWDAVGSLLIGLLLGVVAFFLSRRTHSLLIGESASPADRRQIEALARGVDGMKGGVTQQMSMHLGPNDVLLAIKVAFDRDLTVTAVERAIDTLEAQIRTALPHMRYIFVEPDAKYAMEKDPQRASMVGAER